jgi:hypothetical protein
MCNHSATADANADTMQMSEKVSSVTVRECTPACVRFMYHTK